MGLAARIEAAMLLRANQQSSRAHGPQRFEPILLAFDEASTIISGVERSCKN
jgi:hypothetical protein